MSVSLRETSAAAPKTGPDLRLEYAPVASRHYRRWVRHGAWLVALLFGLGLLLPVVQYSLGYVMGAAEARTELAQKRATVYVYGYRDPTDHFDPITGLRTKAIAGCVVTDWIQGRSRGHNGAIEDYVRRNGPLPYSRSRWSNEITGIAAHFDAQTPRAIPTRLASSGQPARSPDRRFTLAVPSPGWSPGAFPRLSFSGPSGSVTLTAPCMIAFTTQPDIDIHWGAPGSDILFVRFSGALGLHRFHQSSPGSVFPDYYAVLDLRDGLWLRCE